MKKPTGNSHRRVLLFAHKTVGGRDTVVFALMSSAGCNSNILLISCSR